VSSESCRFVRNDANYLPLRGSRSLEVTIIDANGKPVCDILLVNKTNTYLHPISHRFQKYRGVLVRFSLSTGSASFNAPCP